MLFQMVLFFLKATMKANNQKTAAYIWIERRLAVLMEIHFAFGVMEAPHAYHFITYECRFHEVLFAWGFSSSFSLIVLLHENHCV